MKIDLHMHSTVSDGELSPEELVDWAAEKGMKGVAITDHEVVDGALRAVLYAKDKDIEVVSGIEIGADDDELGVYDIHIVGLFLDLDNEELVELSGKLMKAREVQKKKMIEKLNDLGYEITFEELKKEVVGINYGRPHIGKILLRKYPEEFENMNDIFKKLLGGSGSAYVRQRKDTIKNTIDVIHGAGGVAILAHPMLCGDFEKVVDLFVQFGGDGIEVDYFYENRRVGKSEAMEMIEKVRGIAKERSLVVSGGGDFHRKGDLHEIGDYGISENEFLELKKAASSRE